MKFYTAALLTTLVAQSNGFVSPTIRSVAVESKTSMDASKGQLQESMNDTVAKLALASFVSFSLLSAPLPAMADGQTEKFKLPPIDDET